MEKYFDLILTNPLFSGISKEDLKNLLSCLSAKTTEIPKGEPVFLEGDPAGFVGFVLEGAVQIVRDDFYGNRSLLAVSQAGEVFGEAFACANVDTMPVSGYAVQNCKILWLNCRRMLTVCTNACGFHNMLVQNLLQVVAQNNLLLGRKIQFMSGKTTREKLMTYLLDRAKQANSREFTIPLDRQALADFLGVERSAMSAEISKLRADGVLESKGSWFRLSQ
ncbi:MAG: Crp/Fnr family transcriptional regulator [Oscillospiraceae bacterium]|nr:Crp/Fnr family transcriptional regulator [Oscillospiraceae bacterium]